MVRHPVLLLGSVPLGSADEVFAAVGRHLGDAAPCVPDGETGDRLGWVTWYYERLRHVDGIEVVAEMPIPGPVDVTIRSFRLREGRSPSDLELTPMGYCTEALASYERFARAKSEGTIAADARFQVCIPSPAVLALTFVQQDEALIAAFERAVVAEVAEICRAIPPGELAFQWDIVSEIGGEEYRRRPEAAKPHLRFMAVRSAKVMSFDRGIESVARISDSVPAEALVGLHLCFGDADGEHVIDPVDLAIPVEFANAVMRTARRRIDWVHLAVPIDRDDDAYYAPLASLELQAEAALYLGLVHHEDGVPGAERRMAVARRFSPRFGVAAECGLGRLSPELVPEMLDLHRAVAGLS